MMLKKITILISASVGLFGVSTFYPLTPVQPIDNIVQTIKAATPDCAVYPIGEELDLDHNGIIDIADIMRVANAWNLTFNDDNYSPSYDFNNDNKVDIQDIMLIANKWGKSCHELYPK